MILKNILRQKTAQSSVEYLVLFTIIAVLTLLGISQMFKKVKDSGDVVYNKAVEGMGLTPPAQQ